MISELSCFLLLYFWILENGGDNIILGFGIENVSLFQKINVTVGPEQKEIAPQHILLCLTGEGKLVIYYLARYVFLVKWMCKFMKVFDFYNS
jgi:hypothetical protein